MLQSGGAIICGADAFPGSVISLVAEDVAVVFAEDPSVDFVVMLAVEIVGVIDANRISVEVFDVDRATFCVEFVKFDNGIKWKRKSKSRFHSLVR